jgi:uncharacterized protein (DUF362 family)
VSGRAVLEDSCVAIGVGPALYPTAAPFHPDTGYPEYQGGPVSAESNSAYRMVRDVLRDLCLDAVHFGTPDWNPLGQLVPAGARILVKPNWVLDHNQGNGGTDCLVTHPAVLRAVLDYVLLARPAEVVVGDAPLQGCDFEALLALGSRAVTDFMSSHGLPVRMVDFRRTVLREEAGLVNLSTERRPLSDYVLFDLGSKSLLEPISSDSRAFRVTMYDPRKMRQNHQRGLHRYLIAREVLDADLVINLPKLKTHKKAGITAALKNVVGINGNKDYLPHHRKGPRMLGADNYETISFLKALAEEVLDTANRHMDRPKLYRLCHRAVYYLLAADKRLGGSGELEGSWYGNDTVWRMCLDLNRILLYGSRDGSMSEKPQRIELSVADGIVAGQGEGPLKPNPCPLGIVVAAQNPAAADWVSALFLGLNPQRIPIVAHAFDAFEHPIACFPPAQIACRLAGQSADLGALYRRYGARATPPSGWRGHCELSSESETHGGIDS